MSGSRLPSGISSVTISDGDKSVTLQADGVRKPSIRLRLEAPERKIYRAALGMAKAAGERAMADLKSLGLASKEVEPTVNSSIVLIDLVSNAEIGDDGAVNVEITHHEAGVSRVGLYLWMEKVDKIDDSAMKLALDTYADRQTEIARSISDKIGEQLPFDFAKPAA